MPQLALAWLRSLRVRFASPLPPGPGILALWHEQLLLCLPAFADRGMHTLVSRSRDGDWAAWACSRLGYAAARGSSSRGGGAGLLRLWRELEAGAGWAALVVDGPRGPARKSKPGAVWLARQTGLPVYAASAQAFPSFQLRNWDRTVLPAPFARVSVRLSGPFYPDAPEDLDRALIAHENAGGTTPVREAAFLTQV